MRRDDRARLRMVRDVMSRHVRVRTVHVRIGFVPNKGKHSVANTKVSFH